MHSVNCSGCNSFQAYIVQICRQAKHLCIMTVDLICQLFQDVDMHVLFDLIAVTGCYKLYSTMLIGLDFARSEMKASTL